MNESEWLACDDPDAMLKFLGKKYSPRKLRLFACACCRTVWYGLGPVSRRAVEVAERFADGQATLPELDEAGDAADNEHQPWGGESPAACTTWRGAFKAAGGAAAWTAGSLAEAWRTRGMGLWESRFAEARAGQCGLLREIVGNPFRPARVAPEVLAWQGGTIPRMAQALYEGRRFEDLPVLADA